MSTSQWTFSFVSIDMCLHLDTYRSREQSAPSRSCLHVRLRSGHVKFFRDPHVPPYFCAIESVKTACSRLVFNMRSRLCSSSNRCVVNSTADTAALFNLRRRVQRTRPSRCFLSSPAILKELGRPPIPWGTFMYLVPYSRSFS